MTREEALKLLGGVLQGYLLKDDINQIYNDHEAQLKALQQHKSCEGCKHYKFTYNSNDGAVRQLMTICSDCFRRLNRDNYEPKDNK